MFYSYQEVQNYLTDFYRKFHYKLSFPETVTLMGTSVAAHETMEQPDFLTWDAKNEDALKALICQLTQSNFLPAKRKNCIIPTRRTKKSSRWKFWSRSGLCWKPLTSEVKCAAQIFSSCCM